MSFDGSTLRARGRATPGAPDPHPVQYYECWGSRAIYRDGWKAVTNHVNQLTAAERDAVDGSHDFALDRWELYDTRSDPSEIHDLGDEHPELLDELVRLWFAEAERNQVLPIDDGHMNRIRHMRSPWTAPRLTYDLRPGDKVHEVVGPNIAGGFRMVAAFDGPLPVHRDGRPVRAGGLELRVGLVPGRGAGPVVPGRQGRSPHRGGRPARPGHVDGALLVAEGTPRGRVARGGAVVRRTSSWAAAGSTSTRPWPGPRTARS